MATLTLLFGRKGWFVSIARDRDRSDCSFQDHHSRPVEISQTEGGWRRGAAEEGEEEEEETGREGKRRRRWEVGGGEVE